MDFTYKRVCHRKFEETVEAVERCIRSYGFVLDRAHDLQATLASKGFSIQPLRIYEVSTMTSSDTSTGDVSALQCRIHVYVEGEVVYVSAIRSAVLYEILGAEDGWGRAQMVEQRVVGLVDEVTA